MVITGEHLTWASGLERSTGLVLMGHPHAQSSFLVIPSSETGVDVGGMAGEGDGDDDDDEEEDGVPCQKDHIPSLAAGETGHALPLEEVFSSPEDMIGKYLSE